MLLLTLALSAVTVTSTHSANLPPAPVCRITTAHIALERGKSLPLKNLNELPRGNMYSAVYRRVNGCEKPIVVRYNVGRG